MHLIIKSLASQLPNGNLGAITENTECYISVLIDVAVGGYQGKDGKIRPKTIELRFMDSLRFMQASLDSLVGNLVGSSISKYIDSNYVVHTPSGKTHLSSDEFKSKFTNVTDYIDSQFRLSLRKGVYPYEYMDSWDKFDETQLPPISAFHSSLNNIDITQSDYDHAQSVWREFDISNMGECVDLYLKTDTLLLANVFNQFRTLCLEAYSLDPAHFCTFPDLTWQALPKSTGIKLELITDYQMFKMFETGLRGGIVQGVHRLAKANNPYMESSYDPSLTTSYIAYLDFNNLYGWSMCQPLPTGGFRWVLHTVFTIYIRIYHL